MNKTRIGVPFTLEEILETGKCSHPILPPCDCKPVKATGQHTTWMALLVKSGRVAKVGERPSTNPAARGRKVTLYGREEEDLPLLTAI